MQAYTVNNIILSCSLRQSKIILTQVTLFLELPVNYELRQAGPNFLSIFSFTCS